MHACSLISLASFSLCMTLCFILTCCHCLYFSPIYFVPPVLYVSREHLVRNVHSCFGWQPGKICIYFCKFEVKKPNLRLTRPCPLTRVERRDFWPFPSDFPITHTNPIWKQCLGGTWCCLKPHQYLFCISEQQYPNTKSILSNVVRLMWGDWACWEWALQAEERQS